MDCTQVNQKRSDSEVVPQTITASEPEIIVCKHAAAEYISVGIFSFLFVCFLFVGPWFALSQGKHDTGLIVMGSVIGSMFLAASVAFLISLREYVYADDQGVHGRGWRGPEQFIAWENVVDYLGYSFKSGASAGKSTASASGKIIGADGTTLSFSGSLSNSAALARRVRERAVWAKAHDWSIEGARPHDGWPRTFHYQTVWNRVLPLIIVPLAVGGATYATIRIYLSTAVDVPLVGWGFCIISTIFGGLAVWVMAGAYCLLVLPDAQTRARRKQTITLTHDGISFVDGNTKRFAQWEQVTAARHTQIQGMQLRAILYVLETDTGTISFTFRINEYYLLYNAILYNAPRVMEWRLPEDDNALPTRHVTASNVFVHHYRTYSNRLWFILTWSLPVTMSVATLAQGGMGVEPKMLPLAVWLTSICAPPALWAGWRYKKAHIERDSDGLIFYTAFGVRHLLWSQITDFRRRNVDRSWVGVIESRAGRFVIYSWISESDRLVRAIEAHLPASATLQKEQATTVESSFLQTRSSAEDNTPLVLVSEKTGA